MIMLDGRAAPFPLPVGGRGLQLPVGALGQRRRGLQLPDVVSVRSGIGIGRHREFLPIWIPHDIVLTALHG